MVVVCFGLQRTLFSTYGHSYTVSIQNTLLPTCHFTAILSVWSHDSSSYIFLSLKSQVCRLFSFILTTLAFHSNEFKVAAVRRKEKGQRWRTTHSRFQCGWRRERHRHHQCVAEQYRAVGGWKERAVIVASSEAHLLDGDESDVLLSPAQMASCQHGPLNPAWHCLVALFPDIYEIPFISHGPILPAISAGDDLFL